MPIPLYWGEEQVRDFVYIDDLTAALEAAATSDAAQGDVFNIGGQEPTTLREMAQTVVEVVGRGEIVSAPWPEERRRLEVGDSWGDISRAHRVLGWTRSVDLRKGLERTWHEQRRRLRPTHPDEATSIADRAGIPL